MSLQRRTALMSVGAAAALVLLKLSVGLKTHSLGLVSEAAHSGTDLVAALLTFFAVRVSARPADQRHQFGHGRAEHLSSLAEAIFLAAASIFIGVRAGDRIVNGAPPVHAVWYAFAVLVVVIGVDATRASVSWRVSRQTGSAALAANALHFAGDLAGSFAVLVGLGFARAGHSQGDAIAALFVAVLVLGAAARLIARSVDVLMDRAPLEAEAAAIAAIEAVRPPVELRRLRMREVGGRQFGDVVIGVEPGAAVERGHAAADAVEAAVVGALPGSDIVVHVEPLTDPTVRERAHAAAIAVPHVREVHNLTLVEVAGRQELSLHVKLPGGLSLMEAHELADGIERAILDSVPEIHGVQTHLEPLSEPLAGLEVEHEAAGAVRAIVRRLTGSDPRELRFLRTDDGLLAYLTLALDPDCRLAQAHARASEIEEQIRRGLPEISDVVVHTEP